MGPDLQASGLVGSKPPELSSVVEPRVTVEGNLQAGSLG